METPNFDHLSLFTSVYEPSEDTFLFLDALESDLPFILSLNPTFVAEIGSGSGVNITALNKALPHQFSIATDINKDACLATVQTAHINCTVVESFNMEFLNCFRKNVFDLIIFNPPYVVTESEEIKGLGIERSWAGGNKGREVMNKLFPKMFDLLSEKGVFYLVVIKENDPDEIAAIMSEYNFEYSIIKSRRVLGEHLFILRFQKSCKIL